MSNTITAFFKGRTGVAEAVYQNDYGIIMNFDSIELPAHFDCYFSVIGEDEAIPGVGADRQVVIPNACLAKAGNVTLHIPLHTGANDSEVEYVVYFKVIGRARPADDGTPVQMSAIERALALLQNPIGNIEQIVNEALAFTGPTLKALQAADVSIRAEMQQADSVLNARMDGFTHLAEGSTTGDAELIDGRVGADGVTYGNIGTANRTQFTNLKSNIKDIDDIVHEVASASIYASATGWRLNASDGLCASASEYKMVKYAVKAGQKLKIVSDDRFQFQNSASVPSTAPSNRVGDITYGIGEFYLTVPQGATYLIVSTVSENSASSVSVATPIKSTLDALKAEIGNGYTLHPVTTNGGFGASGVTTGAANRIRTELIPFSAGDVIVIESGTLQHACGMWQSSVSSANSKRNDTAFIAAGETISPDYDGFIVVAFKKSDNSNLSPSAFDGSVKKYPSLMKKITDVLPFFKTSDVDFISGYYYNIANHMLQASPDYSYVKLNVSLFKGGNISGVTSAVPNSSYGIAFVDKTDTFISGITSTNTGSYVFFYDLEVPDNAESIYISCRNAGKESTWVDPTYPWDVVLNNIMKQEINIAGVTNGEVDHKLKSARHTLFNSNAPLTILHLTDLHGDSSALARIMDDATLYAQDIDEYICTGDMVSNTATQISSWWDENVLTCIGNHDTASYSDGVYDWTALSMADRDAYYIAPFESGWGITHTSGTSYYYKDYVDSKVRMIVMDGMLYTDNGAEATAQTSWLDTLLADAITNNLHVLIAIHAPHGGAKAIECSFTEYGTGTMPTYSDCNTPQSVIDAVATAIGNGMKFIGYIVGHTHHDVVWDAENDGKQLMYCLTCACVNDVNQWRNADIYRGAAADAFNLITIDTTRTLIKIVRGGGADIDDHMRTRKAICFDYSTGKMLGEVL